MPPEGPEQRARRQIDAALAEAGWVVQDRDDANLAAGRGVAIREFRMAQGHGVADYLLYVDARPVGALEAKKPGHPLASVEIQVEKYGQGLPPELDAPIRPLPFLYMSTGVETAFLNTLDPRPRSRGIFAVHQPETLAKELAADPLPVWLASRSGDAPAAIAERPETPEEYGARPSTLRSRLQEMPPVPEHGLWPNQRRAIARLEESLAQDRPRALVQMATGTGKTFFAVTSLYRLVKFAGARRVLFLVDRTNLGEQAEKEFQGYRTPDDHRKFPELYNVQRLGSDTINESSTVVISTIQRLYSILRGESLPAEEDERSGFEREESGSRTLPPVVYNPRIPPEFFDVIVVDECHRSIYSLWRQVLEYFDAYLIGLTATPAQHTYGFFHQNVVMEYPHEHAVADGVNVDFEIYRVRTRITEQGSSIDAETTPVVGVRDRRTRKLRWETPDETITYSPQDLDRKVVAKDQIRTLIRTFRDKLYTELFPDRKEVPKTLIFAKDDSHAEDVVEIVREEFAEGNEFCRKITYKATGARPADLIQAFRNEYNPRIAVTVDMIATGTDIRSVEIVMFMRSVQSRVLFEQMKGRGVRVIDPTELRQASPSAHTKTHFVIIDCVGITETELADTQPLEKKKGVSFKSLLDHVATGGTDLEMLSSLASRLARLDKQCGAQERAQITDAGGPALSELSATVVDALEPDAQIAAARSRFGLSPGSEPSAAQMQEAARGLLRQAVRPLAENPPLRKLLQDLKKRFDQVIDETSIDETTEAAFSEAAREKARLLTRSFEDFLEQHRDEIDALQLFYSQPYGARLRFRDIRRLAHAIQAPPRSWAELVGKSAVFHGDAKYSFASYLIRMRVSRGVAPEFVAFFMNSVSGRAWIGSVVSQQVGQANVNGTKLKNCIFPFPPAREQLRIVAEADLHLSNAERLIEVAAASRGRCARLRQSILSWAFEGKLVDQDPRDEPADELLARIRRDRGTPAARRKSYGRPPQRVTASDTQASEPRRRARRRK